jgi:tetratricopeptide (TPR) repeat protein
LRHAALALELEPMSGEAWISLAFLRRQNGEPEEAAAAAREAVRVEPKEWRHALRAAYVTWGDPRVRYARSVLTFSPGLALAYWLMTTVFIARGADEAALDEVTRGCAAQDAQKKGAGLPAVGLHLLHGLLLAARGDLAGAIAELTRELSWVESGQLYARECAANTWYAIGAVRLRQAAATEPSAARRLREDSAEAFRRTLAIAPGHAPAYAALHGKVPARARPIDAAMAQAIVLARGNRHGDAARVCREAVEQAPPGHDGWLLPVEPTLNARARPGIWADTLALVRVRAT